MKSNLKLIFTSLVALMLFNFATSQNITISQPNGGEILYPCGTYPIQWTASGTSNYYNIDYSLDGGTIWASVTSNYLSTTGVFNWVVPDVISSTVLIRITDAQNGTIVDESDNLFQIRVSIELTSPNGGETWKAGTTQQITWNDEGTTGSFRILYSTDGSNYTTIVSGLSTTTGTYDWLVPNTPSTNCFVRVQDNSQSCKHDISDANFTILPDDPKMNYPNGGEHLYPNCDVTITWDDTKYFSNVNIEYSSDNGVSWTNIISNTSNDGLYNWTVPNVPSANCIVRVSNYSDPSYYDISDGVFEIEPPITVVSPLPGDTLNGCDKIPITWNKSRDCIGNFRIYSSFNNGITWNQIAYVGTNNSTTQTYFWTVPNGVIYDSVLVKVESNSYPTTMYDETDSLLRIEPSNDITVTSPNGGEVIPNSSIQTITWTNLPSASGQYRIWTSTQGIVANNITGNSYNWDVGNYPCTNCEVRVYDNLNTCKYDQSDSDFTVLPKTPLLTSPDGGEVLDPICDYRIEWDETTFYNNVRIDYSEDGGISWSPITTNTNNYGYYYWEVIDGPKSNMRIRVSDVTDVNVYDISDADFSIRQPIKITAPLGGDTIAGCGQVTVTWEKPPGNCITHFRLYRSIDNGVTWTYAGFAAANGSTTQSYTINLSNYTAPTPTLFKVEDNYNTWRYDVTTVPTVFIPSNDITVTYPNGGEQFEPDSNINITWTNLSSASGQYKVELIRATGTNYTLSNNLIGNSLNWNTYDIPDNDWKIKVSDYNNTCKFDESDAVFEFLPRDIVLTYPVGGETFYPHCVERLTWDPTTVYSKAVLDYSKDGGITWNSISSSVNGYVGYYDWTVPNDVSGNVLVRLRDSYDYSRADTTDSILAIAEPLKLTTYLGGDTLIGCEKYTIRWDASSCIGYFRVYVSYDGGTNWSQIAYLNGSTKAYLWTVPSNQDSDNVLFRVRSNSIIYEVESDSANVVIPTNDITVTAPNGGEIIENDSNFTVTWTNLPSSSGTYRLWASNVGYFASNVIGNSYVWNVGNNPCTNCRVRVYDQTNTCKFDESDAVFTVLPKDPVLTSPNGGEEWYPVCENLITWDVNTVYSNDVRLDYSLDDGITWTNITTNQSNDGMYYWYSSGISSTEARIRISSGGRSDTSDAKFTIKPPIRVITPNGGDTLVGCSSRIISWEKAKNCVGDFRVYVSYNGGNNWSYIKYVSKNTSTIQSTSWTVPNSLTTDSLMFRVESTTNNSWFDVSDSNNTLILSNDITVVTPNGGEVVNVDSALQITWTNLSSASGQYTIWTSTDGNVATNVTGNSYVWNVSNDPGPATIRVYDYVNTCKYDESDASFTILPRDPLMTTPNGGESLWPYCSTPIYWDRETFYNNVRIDYSLNNGLSWNVITTNTSNGGSYNWQPPNVSSDSVLIRVSDATDVTVFDQSDNVFTIREPITLLTPNGGDTLYGCNKVTLTWEKARNCLGNYRIWVSYDDGLTYNTITYVNGNNTSTIQSYTWSIPNNLTNNQVRFKVSSTTYTSVEDESDAAITILPSDEISVTNPVGGEVYANSSDQLISWTASSNTSGTFNIWTSTRGTIATNVLGNSYTWNTGNFPTTTGIVRVYDNTNTCKFGESSGNFTVLEQDPLMTSPNGGEELYAGNQFPIEWDRYTYYTSNVDLEYSLDSGSTWNLITTVSNDGYYNWTIPNADSENCLIKVSSSSTKYDISDSVFTINPAVKVITPNGDSAVSDLGGCTVTSITFERSPAWNQYRIEYSLDGGSNWNVVTSYFASNSNPATYNWTLPNINSDQALVKVMPYYQHSYYDESDNVFSINKPVNIIQPNFGGTMQVGSVYTIAWESDGISNLYDIDYSTDGGLSWTNIITGYNTSTNTYDWTVPNIPSSDCRIRVTDNISSCKQDVSDLAFIISNTPPPITLLNPNGGDTLVGCSDYTIDWTEVSLNGLYDIAYSVDNGSNWINIETNYATAAQSYTWSVPNIDAQALVRVQASGTPDFDLSDALFTIQRKYLDVNIADTTVCSGESVQLVASGGMSYSWSPILGLNNSSIANPIATPSDTTTYTVEYDDAGCIISNQITVNVVNTSALSAGITAVASDDTICDGGVVSFTSSIMNGGSNPMYSWQVNGITVANTPSYVDSNFTDGDSVRVILQSDLLCVQNNPDTSAALAVHVLPIVTPAITIAATPGDSICVGDTVYYVATPVNGGSTPSYQWYVNDSLVGTNSPNYSSHLLSNGDSIYVIMTSSAQCPDVAEATSNTRVLGVGDVPVQPSVIMGDSSVCVSGTYTYSVDSMPGVSYNWTLPTGWTGVSTSHTITVTASGAGGTITVTGNNLCGNSAARSIPVTVNSLPFVQAHASDSSICLGDSVIFTGSGAVSYSWIAGVVDGVPYYPTFSAVFHVVGTDANGCQNTDWVAVLIDTLPDVVANATSTSICIGDSVSLSGSGATNYSWSNFVVDNMNFAPTSTETYVVTGSNSLGCVNQDSIEIVVNSLPTIEANASDTIICNGEDVTLSGSGPATNFTWDNGVTDNVVFNPIVSTMYSVTANDANGCLGEDSVYIVVNALPIVDAGIDQEVCENSTVVLQGSGAVTYTWNNSVIDNSPFVIGATSDYVVTGMDNNGCSATDTVNVLVNANPMVIANAIDDEVCKGDSVTLFGSGADSYTWNFGATDGIAFVPTGSFTYSVTGTDTNGCVDSDSILVIVHDPTNIGISASTTSVCAGSAVTLAGTGNANFTWDNGVLDNISFVPVATNTYTLDALDSNGCTVIDSITITVLDLPTVNAGMDQDICENSDVTLTGSGANSYSWNNGIVNGVAFTVVGSGEYVVTGTNLNGCSATDTVQVNMLNAPSVQANTTDGVLCFGDSTSLFGSGADSYVWNHGVSDMVAFAPTNTLNYVVVGTDAQGCTAQDSITVVVNTLPNVVANSTDTEVCIGSPVTLSATGATTLNWSDGVINNSPFVPTNTTTYYVTGVDINNCVAQDSIEVIVNSLPIVNGGMDTTLCEGSAYVLNGSGALLYTWNNSVTDGVPFEVNGNALYVVVGTDANGCQNTDQVQINVLATPSVSISATDTIVCDGDSLALTALGANSYLWNNSVVNGMYFVPTNSATYNVTGTNLNGCSSQASIFVSVNDLPMVNAGLDVEVCRGSNVTLAASGALTYSWTGGVSNGVSFVANNTLQYIVTGTDLNGCQNTDAVDVRVNELPNIVANTSDNSICLGESITLTGSGADAYTWNFGLIDGATITPTSTATYIVSAVDSNGCGGMDSVTVVVNSIPSIVASSTDGEICIGEDVTLSTVNDAGLVSWDHGVVSGISFNPDSTVTFTATVTNSGGCSNSDQVTVIVNALPIIEAGMDTTICEGELITLSGSGGLLYTWDHGVVNNTPFVPSSTELYEVTGTDGNGCQNTDVVTITLDVAPVVVANASDTSICLGDSVMLTSSGTANSYSWNPNVTENSYFYPVSTTTYTLTGTGNSGCSASDQITIQVNPLPLISISEIGHETFGADGFINISVTGGTPAFEFDWNMDGIGDFDDLEDPSNLTAGSYYVTVGDINGCIDTAHMTIDSYLSVEEELENQFVVYPNPSNGLFKLSITETRFDKFSITITDLAGKIVDRQFTQPHQKEVIIDLTDGYSNGIYLVKIDGAEYSLTKQIILQK